MSAVFQFKDGDDTEYTLEGVVIEPANNGYIVNYTYQDEEYREVFTDKKDLLETLSKIL